MQPSPAVAANAKKSVVIVTTGDATDDPTYFCGFIVAQARVFEGKTYTMIIAPIPFLIGDDHRISVCFFDGKRLPATVVDEDGHFCLLTTAVHRGCVEFSPSNVDITCSPTFMLAPIAPTQSVPVPTHIDLHSLESYAVDDVERNIKDSEKFFLMSSGEYSETTPDGTDCLSGGLVYNQSGIALGAVVQDCRVEKQYRGMKVVAGCVYLSELLGRLLPEVPVTPKKKGGGKRRKRKRGPSSSERKGPGKAVRSV